MTTRTWALPKSIVIGGTTLLVGSLLANVLTIGSIWESQQLATQAVAIAKKAAGGITDPTATSGITTAGSDMTVGQKAVWPHDLLSVPSGTSHQSLAQGKRATVIMLMASWCLYCGYMDRYVWPTLAQTPGVAVNIVDISPTGGIANPGPKTPPFSGHDGQGPTGLSAAQMVQTMAQYRVAYQNMPNLHVYVAPAAQQAQWRVQAFPTIIWINGNGRVRAVTEGALTAPEAQAQLNKILEEPQ